MNKDNTPQERFFKYIGKIDKWHSFVLMALFGVTLLGIPSITTQLNLEIDFGAIYRSGSSSLIIGLFVLSSIRNLYLFPKAESTRRVDLIDNSFGSRLSEENTVGYYTNEELALGMVKFGANIFQNVFFTTHISRKMIVPEIVKLTVFGLAFFALAVYGFGRTDITIPVLQLLFSIHAIGGFIRFIIYWVRNESLLNTLITHFDGESQNDPLILRLFSDYETNLAWSTILLSGRAFSKHNDTIEAAWQELKTKYKIS